MHFPFQEKHQPHSLERSAFNADTQSSLAHDVFLIPKQNLSETFRWSAHCKQLMMFVFISCTIFLLYVSFSSSTYFYLAMLCFLQLVCFSRPGDHCDCNTRVNKWHWVQEQWIYRVVLKHCYVWHNDFINIFRSTMVSQAYRENLDASVFSRVMQHVLKSYQTIPLSFALFFFMYYVLGSSEILLARETSPCSFIKNKKNRGQVF